MTEQLNNERSKALLVAVDLGEYDVEVSLDELELLADTAGADTVGKLTQKRQSLDSATCIGSGRLAEAALFAENTGADLVIFDCELTGSQLKNLGEALPCRVIDRTMLILDIFAQRAFSAEGKLQVELAQQRYLLPRLMGQGAILSRLGGGIGTRGPGETKLETDRRHIRRRISALERELEQMARHRELLRRRRKKDEVCSVAIVGYTNAGKSTLLNALTNAGVLAENRLFATLDPTARVLTLPQGREVLLVDTVGLVRRLPHMLVQAFHSTLEEAAFADLILNVCDISAPDCAEQADVTREVLKQIGAGNIPVITVLNKCDRLSTLPLVLEGDTCLISAKTGEGLPKLLETVSRALSPTHIRLKLLIPYSDGSLLGQARRSGTVFSEDFTDSGTLIDALIELKSLHLFKPYIFEEE